MSRVPRKNLGWYSFFRVRIPRLTAVGTLKDGRQALRSANDPRRSPALFVSLVALAASCAYGGLKDPAGDHAPQPAAFFVATNGNDTWSGLKPSPEGTKADGPFATVPRALKAVGEWKQKQGPSASQSATIFLRGGFY